jgi:Domain of unknown function (DUF4388)
MEGPSAMEKRFEYRGDLAATPLPEILATVARYRVPGVATVTREARERRIFLQGGLVVFATSNEAEMRLGRHLTREGAIAPEKLQEASERRDREGLRLGQILLQMGLLTPEALQRAVVEQVRDILWGTFDWESGSVLFEIGPRRSEEVIRLDLPIPDVIVAGIRRAADVRRLVHRLGSKHTLLERTGAPCPEPLFSPQERSYFDRVDGRTPLAELCSRGPGAVFENARLLYAFFCLGLLHAREAAGVRKLYWRTGGGTAGG